MPYIIYNGEKTDIAALPAHKGFAGDAYISGIAEIINRWDSGQDVFRLLTSGSTGTPKTIEFSRQQLKTSAMQTTGFFKLGQGDHLLCCLPVSHVAGFMMIIRSLVAGLNMIVVKPAANPLKQLDINYSADFTAMVPLQLINTVREGGEVLDYLNHMKAIMVGGGPVTSLLLNEINRVTCPVYETFGMTETLTHIAMKRINGKSPDKFFHPMPGVTINTNSEGRLVVGSPVTQGRELLTNDLVNIKPDGSFEWLGRSDRVVNTGGIKVQLDMAEGKAGKMLEQFGIYQPFFLIGEKDEKLGEILSMVVETTPSAKLSRQDIEDVLRQSLQLHEVPKRIYFIDAFTRSALGKINRKETLRHLDKDQEL